MEENWDEDDGNETLSITSELANVDLNSDSTSDFTPTMAQIIIYLAQHFTTPAGQPPVEFTRNQVVERAAQNGLNFKYTMVCKTITYLRSLSLVTVTAQKIGKSEGLIYSP